MESENRPQLDLGEPVGRIAKLSRPPASRLLIVVLVLQIVVVALIVIGHGGGVGAGSAANDADEVRAVAIDLEERGLALEAADQWALYLAAAPNAKDRAQVFYRIGKARLAAREYERAAAALLRAERAPGCDDALRKKIGPMVVDCLRKAGLHGEVGRELSRRATAGGGEKKPARVLATFAGEPFTETDLDRLIRIRVERILALQGMAGDAAAREALLGQMGDPAVRQEIFKEVLRTELLSRRARELEIDATGEFLSAFSLAEQELLAAMLLEREFGKVSSTDVDLEAYFNAHREEYADAESEAVPELASVRDRVAADYAARKRAELGEQLMRDLMSRYDVKVDPSALEDGSN